MTVAELIASLKAKGIELRTNGTKLKVTAPNHALNDGLRTELRTRKAEIVAHLSLDVISAVEQDSSQKPFKMFDDFPDGRSVAFETEDEWNAFVQYVYQLQQWDQKLRKQAKP